MHSNLYRTGAILGLVLLLWGLSWGQVPPTNDVSEFATWNTGGGSGALQDNDAGTWNTAYGFEALRHNTTGRTNTASGYQALYGNSIGNNNTALGDQAGVYLTKGSRNIYLGHTGGAPNPTPCAWDRPRPARSSPASPTRG